jgi:hypothetical protein
VSEHGNAAGREEEKRILDEMRALKKRGRELYLRYMELTAERRKKLEVPVVVKNLRFARSVPARFGKHRSPGSVPDDRASGAA